MTKLRKQKKRKTYRYNVNRKRMRNKMYNRGNISCKEIKEAWVPGKSIEANLGIMGLSSDPNKAIAVGQITDDKDWTEELCEESCMPSKMYVADELEKQAKAPRARLLRLPNSQIGWITYLMDKYGNDYKAMAKDKKNYYQETWKQLRAKINRFKGIPEQYSKYIEKKGGVTNLPVEKST